MTDRVCDRTREWLLRAKTTRRVIKSSHKKRTTFHDEEAHEKVRNGVVNYQQEITLTRARHLFTYKGLSNRAQHRPNKRAQKPPIFIPNG